MGGLDAPLALRLPARTARALAGAGVHTVGDLLGITPRRYYHWGALTPLRSLREGEDATILAQVASARIIANRSGAGVRMEVELTDGARSITATFFAKNQYKLEPHARLLTPGASYLFAGRVGAYRGRLQLAHPSFEGVDGEDAERAAQRPIPIYPATGGLTSWAVSRAIGVVLDGIDDADVPDPLPDSVRAAHRLPTRARALRLAHRPATDDDHRLARRALAWGEAFILQCALVGERSGERAREAPACPPAPGGVRDGLEGALPFALTGSQRAAIGAIDADLARPSPMQRLLQGDVGSGKTVVALAALARVVDNGRQGALVAPTEVLAEQHFASITALLEPLGGAVGVRLLTGSTPEAARRAALEEMASPGPLIVVGTHALLQDSVGFADLALAVIDEQHRFGVAQRAALRAARADGRLVHELVMTATPIPRTIAMTVFGDLDETRMEGLPAGRAPVATHLVDASNGPWIERLWRRAREEVDSGGRVYVVCPRIDEDDAVADADDPDGRAPLASVASVAAGLRAQPALRGIGVGELTGRTPGARKAAVMADFASGATPVLVATTVVEVGVDVPEATLMVIIDAQQFGLSTLHQLRGRVGRSSRESLCVAVHRHGPTEAGERRLRAFASTTDGFELAEADLRLRKEGDVLGAGQSGTATHLEHLSVRRDGAIIRDARAAAERVIDQDPSLAAHPQVMAALREQAPQAIAWIHRS